MSRWENYQSPYSWRYASPAMRRLWSEQYKRELWRLIWVALAETQHEFGLVRSDQVEDLRAHTTHLDIPRALEIEAEIHHDLMAELKTYAEQCPVGGGILHLGATSMDIEDNADALRLAASLDLILERMDDLLKAFAQRITETAATPVMGYTHLQPAEPTTLGYRLSSYAQDLLADLSDLRKVRREVKGKGFKGAVGTAAAYGDLLGVNRLDEFEQSLSRRLGLAFYPVTTQTYPRKQDYQIVSVLAGIGASLYKFAFDLRIMQSPSIGEWAEPFGKKQVGSSAMPFKRNPIQAEKIDSLARSLASLPQTAWHNAAHSLLERTLDDSANRRSLLPEAFLITDELLSGAAKLVKGMQFNQAAIQRNLDQYAPFAATERILMALARAGADRQVMHEKLRGHALTAWEIIQTGNPNPLSQMLKADAEIGALVKPDQLEPLLQVEGYTGFAAVRARETATQIELEISRIKPAA
ncbi:MAG: adenylosuccinate lyase [Bellilinea sp.]